MRDGNTQLARDPNEIGEGCRGHFLHDVPAMYLKGDFADAEFCSSLFVEKTAHHERQHLALAGCELTIALLQQIKRGAAGSGFPVMIDRGVDCREQVRFITRFGEEIHGAMLDCTYRRRDVAMSG